MKVINKIIYAIVAVLLMAACDFEDTNISPNRPSDVPINTLLPGATVQMFYTSGGIASRFSGIFINQLKGRDFLTNMENFTFIADRSIDSYWTGLYANTLTGYSLVIEKSQESGALDYSAIAKISTAYTLGLMTSFWGDIPYEEALNGKENINPRFDTQEAIYENILLLLDEAIQEIDQETSPTAPAPGLDDLVFSGNMTKWRETAVSLKARYLIHLVKRQGDVNYQLALDALAQGGISSNENDFEFQFGESEDFGPVFEFSQSRAGSLFIDNYFVNLINGLFDPRADFYFISDAFGVNSLPGRYFADRNSKVSLISFAETKFLEAEATLRTQGVAAAEPIFAEAVRASLEKITSEAIPANGAIPGVDAVDPQVITDYVAANTITGMTTEQALTAVLTQKYIALFMNPESWNDFRRTGLPNQTPNTGTQIPTRIHYPNIEFLNNPNFPQPNSGIFTMLWRDAE